MVGVGLLYVGAVLFINGLMLIGRIPGKSAAILNFFVGGMQVIFPTMIILRAGDDLDVIFGAAGLFLFGFTYLYIGILQMTGISGEGLGWFSVFVTGCAVVIGAVLFTRGDPVFAVIWLIWGVLWFMYFLVMGLYKETLTVATGWFTIFVAILTGAIPAFFLLTGTFQSTAGVATLVAIVGAASLVAALVLGKPRAIPHPDAHEVPESQAGRA